MKEAQEEAVFKETKALIFEAFEMENGPPEMSEEALLDLLADQVEYWLSHKIDFLFSLMYRLDVEEAKVEAALLPGAVLPANVGLAKLIFERQKRRAYTKIHFENE